jgi:hypothetical protein
MDTPVSNSVAFANGHWLLAHPFRGSPIPISTSIDVWRIKKAGWSAPGEAGGFVGQAPLASGAPPRGDVVLWQYDPDAGVEILDGEIRVERAIPMNRIGASFTIPDAYELPGDLSWFACYSPLLVKRCSGKADMRFIASNVSGTEFFRQCADLEASHWRRGVVANRFFYSPSGTPPRCIVSGTADFRKSTVIDSTTAAEPGLARFQFEDLIATELVGPRGRMRINATGNVDLSRARSYLYLDLNVDGDASIKHCRRGLRLRTNSRVGGNLDLSHSSMARIETNVTVGGDLILTGARLKELPETWTVSGDVII